MPQDDVLDELPGITRLAAAVIRQAFHDLTYSGGDRYANAALVKQVRNDAKEFLLIRLWESDCLWYELVGHVLVHRRVAEEVKRRNA